MYKNPVAAVMAAQGDLKIFINDLTEEQLQEPNGGQLILEHLKATYKEYLDCPLPKAVENCIFHHTALPKSNRRPLFLLLFFLYLPV